MQIFIRKKKTLFSKRKFINNNLCNFATSKNLLIIKWRNFNKQKVIKYNSYKKEFDVD